MAEFVHYREPRGPKLYKFGKYSFSTIEFKHLGIALLFTILTLIVHQEGVEFLWTSFFSSLGLIKFFSYIIIIGLGFVLHELGHKLTAQYFGHISEFRADFNMLIFMFVLAIFSPIILLAPGAVMIMGRVTKKQNGIISVAGPLVNLTLAILFLILILILPFNSFWTGILRTSIYVNCFLGIFNMLPFWVLDGKKVLAWNRGIYFSVLSALVLIMFLI